MTIPYFKGVKNSRKGTLGSCYLLPMRESIYTIVDRWIRSWFLMLHHFGSFSPCLYFIANIKTWTSLFLFLLMIS